MPAAFVLTIDCEEDMPRWLPEREPTWRNCEALPVIQDLAARHGLRPTYLVTYPLLGDAVLVRTLRGWSEAGACEVGVHLHPWNTPPLADEAERLAPTFPSALSRERRRAKLEAITERYAQAFGRRPRSYRAGRFGLCADGLADLHELGYVVDSSVTPGISWADRGGPDFERAPLFPYRPDLGDVCRTGDSPMHELPVSIVPRRAGLLAQPAWTRAVPDGRPRRALRRLARLSPLWLRPTFHDAPELLALVDRLVDAGAPVLNMTFHSSEVMPGASPYVRSEDEREAYLARLERVFRHAEAGRGLRAATLEELAG